MLYRVLRIILRGLFILVGLKSRGSDNLPTEGAVIVAANHVSNWDPIVVGVILKRQVHFMAKAELFNNKFLGTLLTKVNAFPVRRGAADRKAIRSAMKCLQEGKVLGIFPEGARNKTGEDMKAQSGVAMLALKTGAPVIPVACVGTERKLPLGWLRPLEVRIGEPIYSIQEGTSEQHQKVTSAEMEAFSEKIMLQINSLLSK